MYKQKEKGVILNQFLRSSRCPPPLWYGIRSGFSVCDSVWWENMRIKSGLPRSMPNADQCRSKFWHWSQCRLRDISDQCHDFDRHWSALISIGHWSGESCNIPLLFNKKQPFVYYGVQRALAVPNGLISGQGGITTPDSQTEMHASTPWINMRPGYHKRLQSVYVG